MSVNFSTSMLGMTFKITYHQTLLSLLAFFEARVYTRGIASHFALKGSLDSNGNDKWQNDNTEQEFEKNFYIL